MAKKISTINYLNAVDQSQIKRAEKQEDTRSFIANLFVIGYFIVLLILIGLSAWGKISTTVTQNFLIAIGSPFGFIIGFYFKSSDK